MKSLLSVFTITDRDSCEKAIRNGGIAALISAGITAVFSIAWFFLKSGDRQLDYLLDPWLLLDVWLILVMAVFTFRKCRVASPALVVDFIASKITLRIDFGAPKGVIVSIIFLAFYVSAVRGSYL